jgi:hypothetical protein
MSDVLDRFLPDYRQREVHDIRLAVPPALAWRALEEVSPADLPLSRALLGIRALPALLRGRARPRASGPVLAAFRRDGWQTVAEEPGRLLVAGVIARFWRPIPRPVNLRAADEFTAFRQPGFARAVISFEVLPDGGGSRLVTETRVRGTDARARRLFALYWLVIRPGSGLIRRSILRAARRRCRAAAVEP